VLSAGRARAFRSRDRWHLHGSRNSDNSNLAYAFDSERIDSAIRFFNEDDLDVVHVGIHRHMVLGNVRVHYATEGVVDQRLSWRAMPIPQTTLPMI